MASVHGIPLLSGPPSTSDSSDSCRKCNKEFNFLFTRSRKCNHCGYLFCHSCSDFQALMPRAGPESGYDPVHVCGYCIELLNITAASVGQLRGISLSKLRAYANSYDINIDRAVEKGDVVEAIVRTRLSNGCLPSPKEDYYRKNKVPNPHAGTRPRSFFSRGNQHDAPPPVPPRPQAQSGSGYNRHGSTMGDVPHTQRARHPQSYAFSYNQYQHPPHGHSSQSYSHHSSPYTSYHSHSSQPQNHGPSPYNVPPHAPTFQQSHAPAPPPPPSHDTRPPPPPRPNTTSASRPPPRNTTAPQTPPQRHRTTSTPSQPQSSPPPTVPIPTLDQLLSMTQSSIGALPISVLKNILFTNHVNATMILEKTELVNKVVVLVEDEKRERDRQRAAEEAERLEEEERRRARDEAIQREQEEKRIREEEERMRRERRERQRARVEEVEDDIDDEMEVELEMSEDEDQMEYQDQTGEHRTAFPSTTSPKTSPPVQQPISAAVERSGLCVVCQDEEANIAIVDCGHLAMCRACSELIMASSKECPLCRTRIVTEARLLRIFKT